MVQVLHYFRLHLFPHLLKCSRCPTFKPEYSLCLIMIRNVLFRLLQCAQRVFFKPNNTNFNRSVSLYIIVMDYQKLSNDTFELDRKTLRFAAICDRSGEFELWGMRGGTNSLLSPDQTRSSVLQAWN